MAKTTIELNGDDAPVEVFILARQIVMRDGQEEVVYEAADHYVVQPGETREFVLAADQKIQTFEFERPEA